MKFLPVLAPILTEIELFLLLLRWRGVLRWRWWMMTPLWLGVILYVLEAFAFVAIVAVARDLISWSGHR